jgi:cytoskeletal protein RodZ
VNELGIWLSALRAEAKLSLAALAERTKISIRYLEALERGDVSVFPSRVI